MEVNSTFCNLSVIRTNVYLYSMGTEIHTEIMSLIDCISFIQLDQMHHSVMKSIVVFSLDNLIEVSLHISLYLVLKMECQNGYHSSILYDTAYKTFYKEKVMLIRDSCWFFTIHRTCLYPTLIFIPTLYSPSLFFTAPLLRSSHIFDLFANFSINIHAILPHKWNPNQVPFMWGFLLITVIVILAL